MSCLFPQVLTQDGLATLMTSMMAAPGSLGQPLLIPLSMASSVAGQAAAGGLAVLTFPTATVATLPGLATNPVTSLLKLPFAGLQGLQGLQGKSLGAHETKILPVPPNLS